MDFRSPRVTRATGRGCTATEGRFTGFIVKGGPPDPGGVDTLLLGIDAGCMPVLDPLFDDGRCPNLQSLFERGGHAPMAPQIPPWTPSAWSSLYTGVYPGKHGVFDFVHHEEYGWSLSNATHVNAPTTGTISTTMR